MVFLALVLKGKKRDKGTVKLTFTVLPALVCALSCTPIDSRKAGGGAYDDSEVAQALDANAPLPEDGPEASRSFEEWREQRE